MRLLRVLCLWLAAAAPCMAARDEIPEPLDLRQALTYAEGHPRATPGANTDYPRRLPLYLDCHHLAYSHLGPDDARSRPADALLDPVSAQKLEIMARFLDVLLADLSYARYNEALAVAYTQYDRASVRRELGQYSELLVADLETAYQDILRKRAASEASQRLTRELLAQAMDRPGQLPRELNADDLPEPPSPPPGLDAILPTVLEQARADAAANPAAQRLRELELRRETLELLLRLEVLEAVARYAKVDSFVRDLKLEESRTLYEQEYRADLGFSMSQQTRSRMQERQVAFCRALAWAELETLQGRPILPTEAAQAPPVSGE